MKIDKTLIQNVLRNNGPNELSVLCLQRAINMALKQTIKLSVGEVWNCAYLAATCRDLEHCYKMVSVHWANLVVGEVS